jgi:hypothetical protein
MLSGAGVIVLNHWTSERPVLGPLAERLAGLPRGVTVERSKADREPFRAM